MAVDSITDSGSLLLSAFGSQEGTPVRRAAPFSQESTGPAANAKVAAPAPDNSLLINESPPVLEASEVFTEPNISPGNTLLVNEMLTEVGLATTLCVTSAAVIPAVSAIMATTTTVPVMATFLTPGLTSATLPLFLDRIPLSHVPPAFVHGYASCKQTGIGNLNKGDPP